LSLKTRYSCVACIRFTPLWYKIRRQCLCGRWLGWWINGPFTVFGIASSNVGPVCTLTINTKKEMMTEFHLGTSLIASSCYKSLITITRSILFLSLMTHKWPGFRWISSPGFSGNKVWLTHKIPPWIASTNSKH